MTGPDAPIVTPLAPVGAAPGQAALLQLQVRNAATGPRVLVVSVLGLDSDWLPGPLRTQPLAAGEAADLTVVLTPSAGTPPGSYGFVVAVQPIDPATGRAAGGITQIESTLVVGDPARLAIEVAPSDPQAVRTRRVDVHLANRGNEPLSVDLTTTVSAGLTFTLRRKQVDLPPGGTERIRGRLTAQQRRWVGSSRRMPFILTAQGRTTPVRVDGVFVAHPVLNRTATRLLALVAVIGIWATAGLFAVNAISQHARNSQTETAAGQLVGGQHGGKGGGGAGGSGGKGGSGSGQGKHAHAAGTAPSRLNGTVTGPAPGGATVSLSATSLIDEQPTRTTFVNVSAAAGGPGKLSSATMDLTSARTAPAVRRTTTAKDGSFAFADVKSPGYYLVTLTKPGYQSRSLVVSATAGKPLPTLKVPLLAGEGRLTGSVVDTRGHPLPTGAHVTVTGGTLSLATNTATTGAHRGHWVIDGLSTPGTYVVSASADNFGTATALVHLGPSGRATRTMVLHPGVEAIEGSISFGTGQPLGGATVTATNGTVTRTATSLTTGTPGFYALPSLPVGSRYTVTVEAAGFATQTFRVGLDGSRSAAMQDAAMTSATALVSGTVLDHKTGEPIDSAGLILAGDAGTYKIVSRAGTGEFTFDGVAPGDYTLTVQAFAYEADFLNVSVHAGDVTTLDPISLVPDESGGVPSTSSITGHVVDAHTGAALQCPTVGGAGCRVEVTVTPPPGQPPLAAIHVGADQAYTVPGPDETDPAYAKGLPPGLYKLTFKFPGYEPNTLAVAVPQSTTVSAVPVALVPNGTIIGHITSTTSSLAGCVIAVPFDPADPGKAVPLPSGTDCGTQPSAAAAASGLIPCSVDPGVCIGQIDDNGDYEIKFVPHGTYWVYIRTEVKGDPTHKVDDRFVPLQPVQLTVEAGQSRRYDAVLNQFGTVDVLVQEPTPSGDPGTVGAGITVILVDHDTGAVLPSSQTSGDGIAHFDRVPSGTYVACGSDPAPAGGPPTACPVPSPPPGARTGTTDPFQVSVNENVKVPLVLSKGTGAIIGKVYSLVDNAKVALSGATVLVTGITGYSGQVPRTTTFSLTTDAKGCFAIGPSAPATPADCDSLSGAAFATGSFVVVPDTVTVDTTHDAAFDRYGVRVVRNIAFSTNGSATGVVLDAPPTPVASDVTLHPSVDGATPDQVSLLATKLAPGAGNVVLSADYSGSPTAGSDATGSLVWKDSTLTSAPPDSAVPGSYQIRASLDGYDVATKDFTVPLYTSSAALTTYTISGGISLDAHGALTFAAKDHDHADAPVLGATYTLKSPNIAPVTITAAPDADSVTFPDLSKAAGPYTATVRADGFDPQDSPPVDVVPGTNTTTPVLLSHLGALTGVISGNLGDNHPFPLGGARVVASKGSDTFSTTTDVDGSYSLTGTAAHTGLVPGNGWTVTVSAFGYTTDQNTTVTIVAGNNPYDVTLVARTIDTVTVTVTQDGTSTPVSGATVTLTNSALGTQPACTGTTTNASGVCTFTNVAPLTYGVSITKTGFAPLGTTLTVRVGDHTVTQEFAFSLASRANAVSGTVVGRNLDGTTRTDFTGVNLQVTLKGPLPGTTAQTGTVTAATGEFSFPNLSDGSYRLDASADGYGAFTQTVTVSGGQAAVVNVVLSAASAQVTINVTSSLGVSMAGATVALKPNAVPNGAQDQGTQTAVGPGTASAVFNQVPFGTYDVVVVGPPGQLGATLSGQVVDSPTKTINVEIHEAQLRVQLSSAHDSNTDPPTVDLGIAATPTFTGSTSFTTTVAADGSTTSVYVATPCNASDPTPTCGDNSTVSYTATAQLVSPTTLSDWIPPSTQTATFSNVADGSTPAVQTITFTQVTSLTVTVVDSLGAPVGNVTVAVDPRGAGTAVSDKTLADGTVTFTNLTPNEKYDVSATDGGSPARTDTVRNLTLTPGSNTLSMTIS